MKILLSVIIATYNRASKITGLLEDLVKQNAPWFDVECIVTNDGSRDDTLQVLQKFSEKLEKQNPSNFRLTVLSQENAGQARARQKAIEKSSGEVLVILDDDMRIPSQEFLKHYMNHFYLEGARNENLSVENLNVENLSAENMLAKPENVVVLGRMDPPENGITRQPFEYFYERSLEQMYASFLSGSLTPRGGDLFTGNVALTKEAFLLSGGFSERFKYGEDKELGLRLESIAQAKFKFENSARTIHHSDTPSMKVFAARAKKHGFFDCEIQKMYPNNLELGPANLLNLPGFVRGLIVGLLLQSVFLRKLVVILFSLLARFVIKFGLKNVASYACSLVYIGQYITGAIEGLGGLEHLKGNLQQARRLK